MLLNQNIVGMILSAGLGTRMSPLTSLVPKPMLPILGVPLFEIAVSKLLAEGVSQLHANIHHLARDLERFASAKGWPITLHHEEKLLDTGGGIGNMASVLRETDIILLLNADIVSNIGFSPVVSFHTKRNALYTMILAGGDKKDLWAHRPPPHVAMNENHEVTGFAGTSKSASDSSGDCPGIYGYTGMSVISGEALEYFPGNRKAGLLEILTRMIKERPGSVAGYVIPDNSGKISWGEAGSPGSYLGLHERILMGKEEFDPVIPAPTLPIRIGEGTNLASDLKWEGFLDIGRNAVIGPGTFLKDCVVFENTIIPAGTSMEKTILFPGGKIRTR